MMKNKIEMGKTCYAFDDVLMAPIYTERESRLGVDISTNIGNCKLTVPIIASPMDTVTEANMIIEISRLGGMGVLHRAMAPHTQSSIIKRILLDTESMSENVFIVPAVGVNKEEIERAEFLYNTFKNKIDMFCIDVANGFSPMMRDAIRYIQDMTHGEVGIIAGNVATYEGFAYLAELGVDAVRVGIGGGCLEPNEPVVTINGYKKISEIQIGEYVATHRGRFKEVVDVIPSYKDEELVIINKIKTTKDHKYYVVHNKYADIISEENIHQYAEWIEADLLDEDYSIVSWE